MEKIIEQVQNWLYLHKLPKELAGFTLNLELSTCGTRYRIFSYNKPEAYRNFSVMYDKATKEYLANVVIGLTEYCDINFFAGSLPVLEQILSERLEYTLTRLDSFDPSTVESIFIDKKIIEWPFGFELPPEISGFKLFIRPCEPVKAINGSYIIIDYSDFDSESNLIINYNIYRDEFFGEIRIRRTPQMAAEFDSNTLDELKEKINACLKDKLEAMRHLIVS